MRPSECNELPGAIATGATRSGARPLSAEGEQMKLRPKAPAWGLVSVVAAALVCVLSAPSPAQPKGKAPAGDRAPAATNAAPTKLAGEPVVDPKADKGDKKGKGPKTYDFNALDLNGRMRSPQLLYFLERANEELERASLEKRSFIPHMVRSLEEEAL